MEMDMSMDNSTSAAVMMTSFATSLGGSNLWFDSWTPTSAASTFGASLGLFFLAVLSRFLAAVHTMAEHGWANAAALERQASRLSFSSEDGSKGAATPTPFSPLRRAPPFILAVDGPRALLFAFRAFVVYLLMLAVMSYSAWFFIGIILGMGAGELAFGRFAAHSSHDGGIHL